MADAIQIASRYRYPITAADLARILTHEARYLGDGTLQRKLGDVPGVHEVSYNTFEGEGSVYFTVAAGAPNGTPSTVGRAIEDHLKELA